MKQAQMSQNFSTETIFPQQRPQVPIDKIRWPGGSSRKMEQGVWRCEANSTRFNVSVHNDCTHHLWKLDFATKAGRCFVLKNFAAENAKQGLGLLGAGNKIEVWALREQTPDFEVGPGLSDKMDPHFL